MEHGCLTSLHFMYRLSLKKILSNGLALALPLGVILYVFIKIIVILEKLIGPISTRLGIDRILGELTLTILATFCLILIIMLLGLLMQLSATARLKDQVEDMLIAIVPSLGRIKSLASEKLSLEQSVKHWKPILLRHEEKFNPAYLIEKKKGLVTLYVILSHITSEGEFLIIAENEIQYAEISFDQLIRCTRSYGRGIIDLIHEKGLA